MLAFSEFGRRVRENASRAPITAWRGRFRRRREGRWRDYWPSPKPGRSRRRRLKHAIDFRQVYATLLDRWLRADGRSLLGGEFFSAV